MAKYTLLQYVQKTLSAIDSDDVSDINETIESEQVVELVNTMYDHLVSEYPWEHLKALDVLEVTPVANEMKAPSDSVSIEWVYYDGNKLEYISPEAMFRLMSGRNTDDSNVDANGAYNDRDPKCWSTYNDSTIIFDGYNSSLVSALTKCRYMRFPEVLNSNTDVPDLPDRFHPVLLLGVLAEAFATLKADENRARIYRNEYRSGVSRLKRWGYLYSKDKSTYNDEVDYGRRRGIS